MTEEEQRLTPEVLLQTKDRLLEQWRLLPAEHQATMLLVLVKEIASADMSDWTRDAIATLYPPPEQIDPLVSVPLVTREKLALLDIAEEEIASLTDEDLKAIAGRIEAAFSHEEFWNEVFHQALEFHTEQLLLARHGLQVLLVDRASFPSDTLSTHTIQLSGLSRLSAWGVLDQLTSCRPYRNITVDFGNFSLMGSPRPYNGIRDTICCRRTILDNVLLHAAIEAGVEFRERFSVRELIFNREQHVTGIKGFDKERSLVEELAEFVVGADGVRSFVAQQVRAKEYISIPSLTFSFYSYWSDLELKNAELYVRDGFAMAMIPTNNELAIVVVQCRIEKFDEFRSDVEQNFLDAWRNVPHATERLLAGRRVERYKGTAFQPNFNRETMGKGWFLVGDAACHKDSVTAQGISDAFFDAEFTSETLCQIADNDTKKEYRHLYLEHHLRRNRRLMPVFDRAVSLARLEPLKPDIEQFLRVVSTDFELTERFLGIDAGSEDPREFFAPIHIAQVLEKFT